MAGATVRRWPISSRRARPVENLRVETDAQATGLIHRRPSAPWACAIASTAQTHEVRAAREVILSAGALQSPQLLQLSGIGPADLLRRHGIEIVHDLPGVGQNLQDHLQFRLMYPGVEADHHQ